ncbi:MAG: diguanylate cyclase [Gammaproteobacteria bacterium]|nr:diguanylate cyclase [Gammaproteobacteria bacterium]MDH5800318.1 diguanylate cyclase [Gammaproteobacteria bacterium]
MTQSLCERFGFTQEKIRERLILLDLGDKDYVLAGRLQQEVIVPNFPLIMNAFFDGFTSHPEVKTFIKDEAAGKRIKKIITTFLLSLGSGFDSRKYFEHRLHVGLAHGDVGLSLSLYLCAYRGLTQSIINHFPQTVRDDQQHYEQLVEFLYKINALDMSLAIETYHGAQVQNLEASITGIRSQAAEFQKKAITDALTGIVNREQVFTELSRALEQSRENRTPICLAMADIDHFKKVNDSHGHQVGDSVLIDVARRIKASLRGKDVVGRYGGEEFMLILHNIPLDTAQKIAQRIRLRIADHPINLADLILSVTMSFGLTMARPEDTVETLVKRADEALYAAKHGGRNKVVVSE